VGIGVNVRLDAAVEATFARPPEHGVSLALVVLVDGELVAERYGEQPANLFEPARPVTADTTLISWSMAKSMVHAAVGLLVGDGLLDPEAPAAVPEWAGTDKQEITLLDLLEMRPGLRFVEDYVDGETSHCLDMLFGTGAADMAAYAAAQPLDHPPGTVWNYASGTTNIVARIVGDVISGGPGGDPDRRRRGMEEFLRGRLFDPIGTTSAVPRFDAAGTWVGSSYVYATARDFARFGELYRRDGLAFGGGVADGTRVLPHGWTDHARTFVAWGDEPEHEGEGALRFGYGRHWWLWPQYPGSLSAHGYEGQYTVVVPDWGLTLVHLGKTPADVRHHLVGLLDAVIRAAGPGS
jgi:CubicO group peptidase (beta-lactamase class C family)